MASLDTTHLLLGKLLGEIYRTQRKLGIPGTPGQAHTYALLHGFEDAIVNELRAIGRVTEAQMEHVVRVLNAIDIDPQKKAAFKGFYDIEHELVQGGVDRGTALQVLTYLKADDRFTDLIARMDSSSSPVEARNLNMYEDNS
jgi:hypothetical protein